MYSTMLLVILGLLGSSVGVPVENYDYGPQDSHPFESYNPQDFYSPARIVGGDVPEPEAYESYDTQDSHSSGVPGRIVGGKDAPEDYFHNVALIIGQHVRSLVCGGVLVSRRYVVTAAHCTEALQQWDTGLLMPTTRGQIGSNSLTRDYEVVYFSSHLNHPDWDRVNIKNDISTMTLAEELHEHSLAKPIPLSFERVGGGVQLTVTGWGRLGAWGALPDRLQKLQVYSMTHEECVAGVRQAELELGQAPPVDEWVEICTIHPRGAGHGMCNGDSGSALFKTKPAKSGSKEERAVVGVVSWGMPCARGYPDMYARISGFKDFLVSAMNLSPGEYEE